MTRKFNSKYTFQNGNISFPFNLRLFGHYLKTVQLFVTFKLDRAFRNETFLNPRQHVIKKKKKNIFVNTEIPKLKDVIVIQRKCRAPLVVRNLHKRAHQRATTVSKESFHLAPSTIQFSTRSRPPRPTARNLQRCTRTYIARARPDRWRREEEKKRRKRNESRKKEMEEKPIAIPRGGETG